MSSSDGVATFRVKSGLAQMLKGASTPRAVRARRCAARTRAHERATDTPRQNARFRQRIGSTLRAPVHRPLTLPPPLFPRSPSSLQAASSWVRAWIRARGARSDVACSLSWDVFHRRTSRPFSDTRAPDASAACGASAGRLPPAAYHWARAGAGTGRGPPPVPRADRLPRPTEYASGLGDSPLSPPSPARARPVPARRRSPSPPPHPAPADVSNVEQARIAEEAGAVAVMALERVPSEIRASGGVARSSDPQMILEIKKAVTIPVMAKVRIGHFVEAQVLEALEVDYIDESEVREREGERAADKNLLPPPHHLLSPHPFLYHPPSPRSSPSRTRTTTSTRPSSRSPSCAAAATWARPCAVSPRARP
jgi:hypothetical protein